MKNKNAKKHGEATGGKISSEYSCYNGMIFRCTNKNGKAYKYYGGRGIKVCNRWLESFNNFLEDMGRKPSKSHSLDRINNNGNYEPNNCRWATYREQSYNKETTRYLTFNGKTQPLTLWCDELNLDKGTVVSRIDYLGWSVERTLSTRPRKYKRKNTKEFEYLVEGVE